MPNERRWNELVARLAGNPPPTGVYQNLVQAYSEPHRRYHTLDHIEHCLIELDAAAGLTDRFDEVEFALWLHDVVYDTTAKDNEERSALWALEILGQMGCAEPILNHVRELILATKHDRAPVSKDERLIMDVDLSILGQPPAMFTRYEDAVRSEFRWLPAPAYAAARSRILRNFLDRPRIYFTSRFEGLYGRQARENLRRAIAALSSSAGSRRISDA